MKIESNHVKFTELFLNKILLPFKVIKFPIHELLNGWDIILGHNPNKEFPYPHIRYTEKLMVLPFYNVNLFGWEEQKFIDTDCQKGLHEIGHIWHFTKMPNKNNPSWIEWANKTGHKLDFTYSERSQVPAYENVAYDFEKLYYWKLPKPYFELMGATHTLDYVVLNATEVMKGIVPAKVLNSTVEAIIKKYR
ncbi:MAG: hypothetical protein JM58_09430 [Peptococcaceae bacterium BICA1-8]|nr:MAG: hypothetical protein JM58_09430 [Peptococcaceae bacterium BICA1-8]